MICAIYECKQKSGTVANLELCVNLGNILDIAAIRVGPVRVIGIVIRVLRKLDISQ